MARYFLSVNGLTDGFSFYGTGDVFVGSPAVEALYERTGGKDVDGSDPERLLIEETDRAAYDAYLAIVQGIEPSGDPTEVAGPPTVVEPEVEPEVVVEKPTKVAAKK